MNKYSSKYEIANYVERLAKSENPSDNCSADPIREAQTFRLNGFDSLPSISDYNTFYDFMKMPYPVFIIEARWQVSGEVVQSSIIVTNKRTKTDKIGVISFINIPQLSSGWEVVGDFEIDMNEDGYKVKQISNFFKNQDEPEWWAWKIFEFMVAVNTPNIEKKEVKPPTYINRKRKKKGKRELAGYIFLDLPSYSHGGSGEGFEGKKRSHWRRGHIRRLTDRTTWVRPALIGSGDFVDKTYRVGVK